MMFKCLLITNIAALILSVATISWLHATHTEFAATMNEHLHRSKIQEISDLKELKLVKEAYTELYDNIRNSRKAHDQEAKLPVYVLQGIIVLLLLNLVFLIKLSRRSNNAD